MLAPHVPDLNVGLMLKFIGFFRSLLASPSSEVVVVALLAARDVRSNLGKNLALVREASGGLDPLVAIIAVHWIAAGCAWTWREVPEDF